MPGKPWTDDDLATLRELNEGGYLASDIAAELDRSRLAVKAKSAELGLKSAWRWTDDEVRLLRIMKTAGRSDRQIAKKLGRGIKGVREKLARLEGRRKT